MKNHLKIASILANLLDNQFNIFGTKFGFSAIIDLIPVVGDIIDTLLSLYIVWIAYEIKVPTFVIIKMVGNIAINFLIGLIPIIGDSVYFIRKVNLSNLELLKKYAATI